jgi:hypothetical protein
VPPSPPPSPIRILLEKSRLIDSKMAEDYLSVVKPNSGSFLLLTQHVIIDNVHRLIHYLDIYSSDSM